jgi:hypothetical protein
LQVPKLPGQDVSHFDILPYQAKNNRKILHIECDKKDASVIEKLAQYAKESLIFQQFWGRHAHISEVVDKSSTPSEIRRLTQVAQRHTNYQCSMLVEDIHGISITDLEGSAPLLDDDGSLVSTFSMRSTLLRFLKLSDGHQLIAEIHQEAGPMGKVQAVIPNSFPEAERMVGMLNKNFPAYMGFYLRDNDFPDDFIKELLKRSCCQETALQEADGCRWDSKTKNSDHQIRTLGG